MIQYKVGGLLVFCILVTSKIISGQVPTCDIAHSWQLYSAFPLRDQTARTRSWYPTQLHYPDKEPTSIFLILITPITWLGSDKYQFLSHWFDSTISSNPQSQACETRALLIQPLPHVAPFEDGTHPDMTLDVVRMWNSNRKPTTQLIFVPPRDI